MGLSLPQNKRLLKPILDGFFLRRLEGIFVWGWHFTTSHLIFELDPQIGILPVGTIVFLKQGGQVNFTLSCFTVMTRHTASVNHFGNSGKTRIPGLDWSRTHSKDQNACGEGYCVKSLCLYHRYSSSALVRVTIVFLPSTVL